MNKTSELIEELIKINNELINENEDLKKQLEQNTIIESETEIETENIIIEKTDIIKYGRLIKFFRDDRVIYVRELLVNGKKVNVPLAYN